MENYLPRKIESIESFCDFIETGGDVYPVAPLEVNLEVSNLCNFKCAMCEQFSKLNPHRHRLLKRESRKFLDIDVGTLGSILESSVMVHCFGYGEVTIHPRFDQIISQLSEYGVLVDFFTNAQEMDRRFCELLVEEKVAKITISFSGSTKTSYENIYLGGDFNTVIENITYLVRLKQKRNTSFPRIEINSLAFRHHVETLPDFVRLMGEVGVDAITLKPLIGSPDIPHLHQHIALYREEVEGPILRDAHALARNLGLRLNTAPFENGARVGSPKEEMDMLSKLVGGDSVSKEFVRIEEIGLLGEQISLIEAEDMARRDVVSALSLSESELREYYFLESYETHDAPPCLEPFQRFYVKGSGEVKPCCFGLHHTNVGIVGETDSEGIWSGAGYQMIRDGILDNRYPMNLCRSCLQRSLYPKSHNLANKVNLYREWLYEGYGVTFPEELFERVKALPATIEFGKR